MSTTQQVKKAVLVYQAGIANVFAVGCFNLNLYGRDARRLMQSDFRSCEMFARGLAAAGVLVGSAHCNHAGDISDVRWSEDIENAPFFDKMIPVYAGVAAA